MSVMEKRLQLLLDRARYEKVEAEAKRSGRSVAAVIREAIDFRFDAGVEQRSAAAARLLARTEIAVGVEPDWADTKAQMEAELEAELDRKFGR